MRITTQTTDRKQLAQAIADRLHEPYRYNGVPGCTYSIGPVTVERDGSVTCDDEQALETLRPYFMENGWLECTPEPEPVTQNAQTVMQTDPCEHMIRISLEDATPVKLIHLLRILYTRQRLINVMLKSDFLYVDEEVISQMYGIGPHGVGKIYELIACETRAHMLRGVQFTDNQICFDIGQTPADETGWRCLDLLLGAIVEHAFSAHHVGTVRLEPRETEMKYFCHSWLIQLGFAGPDYKALRAQFLGHLPGFSAFRTAEKMQAHKAKLAEKRRVARENMEVKTDEADR